MNKDKMIIIANEMVNNHNNTEIEIIEEQQQGLNTEKLGNVDDSRGIN